MLLTRIAHLALIKTALIVFGPFRAGVILKILLFALINSRTNFSHVKYLTSYIRVIRYVGVNTRFFYKNIRVEIGHFVRIPYKNTLVNIDLGEGIHKPVFLIIFRP